MITNVYRDPDLHNDAILTHISAVEMPIEVDCVQLVGWCRYVEQ